MPLPIQPNEGAPAGPREGEGNPPVPESGNMAPDIAGLLRENTHERVEAQMQGTDREQQPAPIEPVDYLQVAPDLDSHYVWREWEQKLPKLIAEKTYD